MSETHDGTTISGLEKVVAGLVSPQRVADEVECAEELGLELRRDFRIADLRDAYKTLAKLAGDVADGPHFPWSVLDHAKGHVDRELTKLCREKCGIEAR